MRPSLLLCCFLLCLGCARTAEPVSRAEGAPAPQDAGDPALAAAECRTDDDCTLSMIPEGDSCPRLCAGRPVTVAEGAKLDARQREYEEREGLCPIPPCAPPRMRPVAVCTGGRCGTRQVPSEMP